MKYNLSNIMKRAWELVKKAGRTISEGLKTAWVEAKMVVKAEELSTNDKVAAKLQELMDREGTAGGYHYQIRASKWEKYGKSRTYYKIIETRNFSKRYAEYDFGYVNNTTGEYVPGRSDAFSGYDLSGERM